MRTAIAIVLATTACASKPAPQRPERDAPDPTAGPEVDSGGLPAAPLPKPPTGFATCELVTTSGGVVTAYAIGAGGLQATGTTTIAKVGPADPDDMLLEQRVGDGDWTDRDHLFLISGPRAVIQVTASAIVPVEVPPPARFKRPKPASQDGEEMVAGDLDAPGTGLVVQAGAAWWSECPWGMPYDGFQCEGYVHARLWPTPALLADQPRLDPRRYSWPTAVPAGFSTRTIKRGPDDAGVACIGPGNQRANLYPADESEVLDSYHWVSTTPPRLLVLYGHGGLDELILDRWALHAGCDDKQVAGGTTVVPGPNGLWLAREGSSEDLTTTRQVVYRGATVVGELPDDATVLFRPAK